MADYSEVLHGFGIFNRYFLDADKRKAFVVASDSCAPGAADDAFAIFNIWWQDLRLNTYIPCVSKHQDSEDMHGRLSMWRAFGGRGTRVGIVLRFPYMSFSAAPLALTFSPVAYLPESGAHEVLDQVVANVQRNRYCLSTFNRELLARWIFQTFASGIVCLKHEAFTRSANGVRSTPRSACPLLSSSLPLRLLRVSPRSSIKCRSMPPHHRVLLI